MFTRVALRTALALAVGTSAVAQERVAVVPKQSIQTHSSLSFNIDAVAAAGKISPTFKSMPAASTRRAVVLLWNQEVTNPSLDQERFATMSERFHAEAARAADEVIRSVSASDVQVRARFQSIAGFTADLTESGIQRLATHPYVRAIVPDVPVSRHRVEGTALMSVPAVHARGQRGAGVTVAVIDDGVDFTHPELGGAAFPNSVVIGGYDFQYKVEDPSPITDRSTGKPESHGTSVAAIIAGRGASGNGAGVAPEAKIVGLRTTTYTETIQALDWVATNHTRFNPPIRVVNMSIGFDGLGFFTSNCDGETNAAPMREAVARLTALKIAAVGSAGNENKTNSIQIPGCVAAVISVGAVYDGTLGGAGFAECSDATTASDQIACYSNSASYLQLLAPSHLANTAQAGGGYNQQFGGTSAAAPYASGSLALLMSAFPGRSVSDYLGVLKQTGKLINDSKSGISTARVDVDRAYQALSGANNTPGAAFTYFVPAIARAAGANNTFFQTDLRIFNGGSGTANVDAFLLDQTENATAFKGSFTVAGGQSVAFNDAVQTVFRLGQGVGGMVLFSNRALTVTSTTYTTNNVCPEKGGTLGQYIPGASATEGGTRQVIYNLVQNNLFRTNVGVVNTKTTPANVTVTIMNGNGTTMGHTTFQLGTYGWRQLSRVIEPFGSTGNAYAIVTSDGPILSYASVVDNATGDPYYVSGRNE